MKKGIAAVCLLIALFASMLVGCGEKKNVPEPEPAPEMETAYQEAMRAYEAVMDETCDVIYNGYDPENDYLYASFGVIEISSMPRDEQLQYLGYTFQDISGDGIPELLIGTVPNKDARLPEVQLLFGGYTCKDGEPVCFLGGRARDVYEWLGGGRFYYYSSGWEFFSGFGTFRISPDGTELACEEWYFSDRKNVYNDETAYYHNTTGVRDKDASEELDIGSDAFWALSDKLGAECKTMELTPFAEYPYTKFEVTEKTAYEGVSNYCHETYDWSAAEDNPDIMYVTLGEETDSEYQVIFRSYTGALVCFYVDKASGEARMVERVPDLEVEEEAGSINIFDYLK